MDVDAGVVVERGRQFGDGDADAGAVAVQRADVEGEANGVHGRADRGARANDPARRLGRA